MELFKLVGSIFIDNEKADNSISKTDEKAEKLSKKFLDGVQAVGKWGTKIATATTAAVGVFGAAVTKIAEDTREYRNEMAKLDTAFEDSNFQAEVARDTYKSLQSILGDTGQAVEASNFLAELCNTEKELADWTTICTGVYAKFGVSLPIEGLTEASNETAKTGVVTGNLADALNWAVKEGETFGLSLKENIKFTELSSKEIKALTQEEKAEYEAKKAQYEATEEFNKALSEASTAEDIFNLALAECSTEQERQALITETLHGLYSDVAEKYRENNEAVLKANEAQEKLNEALAEVGALAEPVVTGMKLLCASILEKVVPATENFNKKAESLKKWLKEIGDYSSEKLSPILSDLEPIFSRIKDAAQYVIDKLNLYIDSGSAAKDITNLVKDAIDFLAEAYEKGTDKVKSLVQGFKDAVEWGKNHETQLGLIAIAIGTFTTLLLAYNSASIIKKALDVAETAQIWLMIAADGAHTIAKTAYAVATGAATAATTAFGAALTFLTSPVAIVIAIIGALIAIVYMCVKHWDELKEIALYAWEKIKEGWNSAAEWFDTKVVQPLIGFFENLWKSIVEFWDAMYQAAVDDWNATKNAISEKAEAIKTKVKDAFENIKTSVTNKIDDMKKKAVQKMEDLKNGMTEKINSAKEKVSNIVDKIKGLFDFTFKVPKIKTPHFSIKPKGWDIGDLLEGSIPKLGIEWYAKAMNKPVIMKSPTAFGINARGEIMAGGEAGAEVVSGVDTLTDIISRVVSSNDTEMILEIRDGFDRLIALLSQYLPELANMQMIIDVGNGMFVKAIAKMVLKELGSNAKDSGKVKGSTVWAL